MNLFTWNYLLPVFRAIDSSFLSFRNRCTRVIEALFEMKQLDAMFCAKNGFGLSRTKMLTGYLLFLM